MKEAADVVYVTPRSVAAHTYTVMETLQPKTTAGLVQCAIKQRMISV
jgi:hypothetical protein